MSYYLSSDEDDNHEFHSSSEVSGDEDDPWESGDFSASPYNPQYLYKNINMLKRDVLQFLSKCISGDYMETEDYGNTFIDLMPITYFEGEVIKSGKGLPKGTLIKGQIEVDRLLVHIYDHEWDEWDGLASRSDPLRGKRPLWPIRGHVELARKKIVLE
jgi:hypothetical protein